MLENLPDTIGHALRGQRAGLENTAFWRLPLRAGKGSITLASLAFIDHGPLPERYTADGAGFSPPLQWSGVPAGAASLVLMVEDADSPTPRPLVHAIAAELPAHDGALAEDALDNADGDDEAQTSALKHGRNSYLQTGWIAPDPPPGHGVHRYVFQLFALSAGAVLPPTPGRDAIFEALEQHAIASGCIVGTYVRNDTSVRSNDSVALQAGGTALA